MALTTRTLPALMNGISQQPAILRSPDQTEDEVNTWGKIATGLARRPPTTTVDKIGSLPMSSNAIIHHINRDVNERYTVVISQNSIRVFDEATGDEKTVNAPHGWGYLNASGANAFAAVTIADYTFIVDKYITVGIMSPGADLVADPLDYRWPGGSNPSGLDAAYSGAVLANGGEFQYAPNPTATSYAGIVSKPEDLPDPLPPAGTVYKVRGDTTSSFVSYYVMSDGTVWNETVKPSLSNKLNPAEMPHVLIRESDGTFTFSPFSWKVRRVGDDDSNPYPLFVGRKIRDIFFYNNRLGFVVDESVVFSAAGDYGDFWRRTVLDYIDSDTLAASAATMDVNILDFAIPFADGVMLFSGQRQFSLTNGESGLSARSIAIQPVTNYIMSPNVKPSPLGSVVHFCSDAKGYVALQEYTRLAGADPTEAADVTAHVPKLIPAGASQIISAPDLDAVFVLVNQAEDEAERKKLYAYQFFWDGDKKIQSAWRVWDFGDGEPISGSYESGALTLLMERPDGFFFERINLSPAAVSDDQEHMIYLDRSESVTGTYDAVTDKTTFNVSFQIDADKVRLVRGVGSDVPESVISSNGYEVTGTSIKVPGDESGYPVTIGHLYETRVAFSQQYPLDWQGRALTTGRLQLHTFTVNTIDTVYLRAEVYPYGLDAATLNDGMMHSTEFSGQVIGTLGTTIGQINYTKGPFTFSVAGNSQDARIEVVNDTPYASTITSGEWEGLYFSRVG